MMIIIDIQNTLLLKLYQLDRLTDLHAFWDFAILLNKCAHLFVPCHNNVTFACVIIDSLVQHPIGCKYSKRGNKMRPKEVIEKTYIYFASGGMEAFTKLHTPDC